MGNSFIGTLNSEGDPDDDPNMLVEVSNNTPMWCKFHAVVSRCIWDKISSHIIIIILFHELTTIFRNIQEHLKKMKSSVYMTLRQRDTRWVQVSLSFWRNAFATSL